ncbi:MAG: hydroxyacid dehydrogenase [Limnochordia bacterium]|jgi:D-3-phosphoglycerate dehydrogenase
MARKKVLLTQAIHESGVEVLAEDFDVKLADDFSVEGLKKEVGDVHGILARTALLPREVLEAAPHLEVVARHGVGVDNIDVAYLTEKGIPLCFTPTANALSVAEWTLTAISALAKGLLIYDRAVREGNWERRNEYKIIDIDGKKLGLVGLGRIGTLVAAKAKAAYNMEVLVFDPYVDEAKGSELGVTIVKSLEELLPQVDFLSLHLPLTEESRDLIGAEELAQMKETAFLINAARGGIVNEEALVKALRENQIAGAALDVFEAEPPAKDSPLWELDNLIVAPHLAALTQECVIRMATIAAQGIKDVLQGRKPEFVYNREIFDK